MTTAAERLVSLSGLGSATAAEHLIAIGSGATAGAILANYSGLVTGTAAEHLLTDVAINPQPPEDRPTTGGGGWRRVTGSAAPLQILYRPRLLASGRSRASVVATAEAMLRLRAAGRSAAHVAATARAEAVAWLSAGGLAIARASVATDMPIALAAGARGMAAAAIRAEHDGSITFAEAAVVLAWMRSRQ